MKKSLFELQYIDGPFGCTGDGEPQEEADVDLTRRAWWRGFSVPYDGFSKSRDILSELWERERFDGVLGFSQGAAVAGMLAAEFRPRFAILISGFVPKDEEVAAGLLAGVEGVPSLHVIGLADTIMLPERSRALAACFAGATVAEHEGGHMIPSKAVKADLVAFLDGLTEV